MDEDWGGGLRIGGAGRTPHPTHHTFLQEGRGLRTLPRKKGRGQRALDVDLGGAGGRQEAGGRSAPPRPASAPPGCSLTPNSTEPPQWVSAGAPRPAGAECQWEEQRHTGHLVNSCTKVQELKCEVPGRPSGPGLETGSICLFISQILIWHLLCAKECNEQSRYHPSLPSWS